MGMDVYGKNIDPKTNDKYYFRASVWSWHPLWDLVEALEPAMAAKVPHAHFNSGEGLSEADSIVLGAMLRARVEDGTVAKLIAANDAAARAMPDETCVHCNGSGRRNDQYVRGRCNGCKGTGKVRPFSTWYAIALDHFIEFVDFLEKCGGFEIW